MGGFKIVLRMSERQQIVLLICEVGGCVCVCVRVFLEGGRRGVGGEKKPLSLTPDDIFGSTSKVSQGGSERSVQATDRALLLLALLLKKIQASLWLSVYVFVCVCVLCMHVHLVGGVVLFFFFFSSTNR